MRSLNVKVPLLPLALALVLALALAGFLPGPARAQEGGVPPGMAGAIPPIVWQLTEFPGVGPIDAAGLYTVQFLPDGTISARADCNWKNGVWTGGNGALDVTITMSTLALCEEGSLEDPFTQALDAATSYSIESMTLVLSGPNGALRFSPALPGLA